MLCLMGLFLYGTAPLGLLAGPPTWRLPVSGHVACLVTADLEVSGSLGIEVSGRRVLCVSGSGMVKKNSTKQKPPCTPRWFWDSVSSTGVEEVVS